MKNSTDPRVILSQMLKSEAARISKTDPQKSAFLLKMSKDVLSEGPIDSKLSNIRNSLGLPDLQDEYVKRFGKRPVVDVCAETIRNAKKAIPAE